MRLIVQRVSSASVSVNGEVCANIGCGMLGLVGIAVGDDPVLAVEWGVRKLLGLRLWEDSSGKAWASSVVQSGLDVLLVSQFTLHAVLKGNKPDFHRAMGAQEARALWDQFVSATRAAYKGRGRIDQGPFGANMQVALVNDGPATIQLDGPDPPTMAPPRAMAHLASTAAPGTVSQQKEHHAVLVLLPAAGACSRLAQLERRGCRLLDVRSIASCSELGSCMALAALLHRAGTNAEAMLSNLSRLCGCRGRDAEVASASRGIVRIASAGDLADFFSQT